MRAFAPLPVTHASAPGLTEHDVSGLNVVEHRFDELGLDLDMLVLRRDQPIPLLDRPDGRSMRCSAIKVVDPEVVVVEEGDPTLEPVEPCIGVLADRDQDVGLRRAAVERARQLLEERSLALLVAVVEEVLLELVEDEQNVAIETVAPGIEQLGEAQRAVDRLDIDTELGDSALDSGREGFERIIAPRDSSVRAIGAVRREDDDDEARLARGLEVSSASVRRCDATPARRSELLPTPLGP